jgi:hypothetical protein
MRSETFRFEIPKQTTSIAPLRRMFTLWLPVIDSVRVIIPKGHKGLAHLTISAPGFVILNDVYGDDRTVESGALRLRLFGPPYMFECVGYNDDVFLSHEFVVEVKNDE